MFGDEQENITAGWLILKGLVPYKDFFFHHAPLPFFIAGLAEFLSPGNGLIVSRMVLYLLHVLSWFLILFLTHKNLRPSVYAYMLSVGILSPIFHLHMLLADTIIVQSLAITLFVIISWLLYKSPSIEVVIKVFLVAAYFSILSSLASVFMYLVIAVSLAYKQIHDFGALKTVLKVKKEAGWMLVLTCVFPLYFFVNAALADFY
ncbi:MAG: hypothetical protein COU67_03975 [Candidatus Pacebacteria bacterium CG10_big_fil_rev_8_21_14_0_10_44_54]|nr:MAG: hypothetical protein COU67_03975 [Candidatus Pacebacteria bacterium CG10_big_fil_rev_8_21_14_0_10_44_54]